MAVERRRVWYRGQVQGVGFRATAHRLARQYAVTGFVRNLADGRVELVAEGEPSAVSAFLGAVGRALGDYIQDVEEQPQPPGDPPFSGFSIRY